MCIKIILKKHKMEIKYSKTEFEGYTHRFIIEFEIGEPHTSNIQLYSNSGSYLELENFINENRTKKVLSFRICHRASKEQDDLTTQFLNEFLETI